MPGENETTLASQQNLAQNKSTWTGYYGLPSWMRVPIDRLNIKTDFEEYACSPPEVESGFVPEFETKVNPESPPPPSQPQPVLKTSRSAPMLSEKNQPLVVAPRQTTSSSEFLKEVAMRESAKLIKPGALPQQLQLTIPLNLTTNSATPSAENTPNSTPQGSPYVNRKGNRSAGGLPSFDESPCSNNPKKWFYTGLFEKSTEMSKAASLPSALNEDVDSKSKDLASKCPINQEVKREMGSKEEKKARKVALPSPGYKKYTVSNFDLNAVSPTSW